MIDARTRIFIVICLAACAMLVVLLYTGHTVPAAMAKLVASSAFIAIALQQGATGTLFGRFVLAGLAFSWCGDMFLIGTSEPMFLAGLCAFLLGHIAYVMAFVAHGYKREWAIAAAVPIIAIAIAVWTWLEPHTASDMRVPVGTYIAVISVMVILAFGTRGKGGSALILAGAVMFFLSDLSVAALRILETGYATYVLGLPLYFGGQVCLALSVSQSRSH